MKNKDKAKKIHESKIGKIIYGFLLFMPLLAILFTCGYVMFNKNAYQSYGDEYVEESIQLDSSNVNSLYVTGQHITYTFGEKNTQWNAKFGFTQISINLNEIFNVTTEWNAFYLYNNNNDIRFYTTDNQSYLLSENDRLFNTFTYVVDLSNFNDKTIYNYGIAFTYTFVTSKLSNVFYYSVNQVEESNLFNWAKTSGIYTTTHSFTQALSITNTFIPMLMTYWLIISVVYILYDIVLMMLVIFHKKVHKLQDSI